MPNLKSSLMTSSTRGGASPRDGLAGAANEVFARARGGVAEAYAYALLLRAVSRSRVLGIRVGRMGLALPGALLANESLAVQCSYGWRVNKLPRTH